MGIAYYPEKRLFVLTSGNCTYALMVHPLYERLVHLYYGASLDGEEAAKIFADDDTPRAQNPLPAEAQPGSGSLGNLAQEFSSFGCGDFRAASARIRTADGFDATDAKYVSHRIYSGKPELPGLPSSFAGNSEAQTLEITLCDPVIQVEFVLSYSIFSGLPAVVRSVRAVNRGERAVTLEKLASLTLDFPAEPLDVISFHGAWVRERHFERAAVEHGIRCLGSNRGFSGHQTNPFFIICDPDAGETHGRAWGQMLVYSGCHLAEIERDQYETVRLQFGLNPERFRWRLEPGESFQSPEAVTAFSDSGFEDLSRTFHDFLRDHVIDPKWAHRPRPAVINNWEATRFDFTEEQILAFAKRAAELGLDMLVLDDGWFGKRDDGTSSLGDWVVYDKKLPSGLPALSEKIHALGLKFGLWFEPEMVSPDSDLYRAHPDWCLHIPGRPSSLGRHQLVLDMGRPEVVEYLFRQMTAILDAARIEYVKWDANRPITEAGSALLPPERQGEAEHRFVLGTYALLEKLRRRYPEMLFEGCTSGGGRFDAGMLYYTPQIWTSDDTDAIERLYIQYGTSFGYPQSTMGAHVSAVPNHHAGRVTPLTTRGDVAMTGAFGYELDPGSFSPEDDEVVKRQLADFRATQQLLLDGFLVRLGSPHTDNLCAWMTVARDRGEFVFTAVRIMALPNPKLERVRLRGLDPDAVYADAESGETFSGRFLMQAGLPIPVAKGDFKSFRRHFRRRG